MSLAPMDLDLSTYDGWIYPERRCVQVVCWWEQTRLHKQIIFSVPLLPYTSGFCPNSGLQRGPMPSDTQAVFTVEILLNIVRGSLGGFYIPHDVVTDSRSHEDNMFRFTFHGQHSESHQEPGHQLSTEELSVPLTELVGKLLWIKAEWGSPPTQNLVNIRMQSTVEDKRNWATYIKRDYPKDIARCPFTACLSPIACHIIECGLNDQAYELLAELSHVLCGICGPHSRYIGEPGFLDVGFPIPAIKAYKLYSLPLVETHTNGMTYGWDPQILPSERDTYQGERKPRKIRDRNSQAQLQDLAAIISFVHGFGTGKFLRVIREVVGRPPQKKRKTKQQDGSRKRARSDHDNDDDVEAETDSDTDSESDDEILIAHKRELVDTELRNINAQTMLIWLANCWSIQAKQNTTNRAMPHSLALQSVVAVAPIQHDDPVEDRIHFNIYEEIIRENSQAWISVLVGVGTRKEFESGTPGTSAEHEITREDHSGNARRRRSVQYHPEELERWSYGTIKIVVYSDRPPISGACPPTAASVRMPMSWRRGTVLESSSNIRQAYATGTNSPYGQANSFHDNAFVGVGQSIPG
ncbi:hypothetical protein IW262DRAFT_1295427 [Armillaria fumosa]|nr:hypothetical protein IW262DRAFT_1295427 [Armillaria fumosa]